MTPLHIKRNTSQIPLVADESLGTDLEQQHLTPATTHSLKAGSLLGQLSLATGRAI